MEREAKCFTANLSNLQIHEQTCDIHEQESLSVIAFSRFHVS